MKKFARSSVFLPRGRFRRGTVVLKHARLGIQDFTGQQLIFQSEITRSNDSRCVVFARVRASIFKALKFISERVELRHAERLKGNLKSDEFQAWR